MPDSGDSHLDSNDPAEIDIFTVVVCGSLRRGATRGVTIHPGHTVEAVCGPGRSRWHHNVTSRCLRFSSPREINRSIFSMTTCSKISAAVLRIISVSRAAYLSFQPKIFKKINLRILILCCNLFQSLFIYLSINIFYHIISIL